jgi:hypothetical protein
MAQAFLVAASFTDDALFRLAPARCADGNMHSDGFNVLGLARRLSSAIWGYNEL